MWIFNKIIIITNVVIGDGRSSWRCIIIIIVWNDLSLCNRLIPIANFFALGSCSVCQVLLSVHKVRAHQTKLQTKLVGGRLIDLHIQTLLQRTILFLNRKCHCKYFQWKGRCPLGELTYRKNYQKQGDIAARCSQFVGDEHLQLMWSDIQKNQEIALNTTIDSTWEASSHFVIWLPSHTQDIPKRGNAAITDNWTFSW